MKQDFEKAKIGLETCSIQRSMRTEIDTQDIPTVKAFLSCRLGRLCSVPSKGPSIDH